MRTYKRIIVCSVVLASLMTNAQQRSYHKVQSRPSTESSDWKTYEAKTIDRIPGFKITKQPPTSVYGGWIVKDKCEATGYFRTEKINGRWWFIDPLGYPFIHKGMAVFSPGSSKRQKQVFTERFGTNEKWAAEETELLRKYGFNGLGAWTDVNTICKQEVPLAYTVIVNPMGQYRTIHKKRFGGKYLQAGWQGYRFDLAMVFDPEFDQYIEQAIAPVARYKEDKHLLGYFTDNELPWVNDALDRHLTLLAKDEAGYLAAKEWFDKRKGADAKVEDITETDRLAFSEFYFDTYMRKVVNVLRKYDPNHLYLGCRFNQHNQELNNPAIFRVAGKYMDVISINHYRRWEPSKEWMEKWGEWSGKPFIITEFYTRGEDSGLPNNTGAGWNVPTQQDRGYFYQNFVMELLKSGNCIGWDWFKYLDNDPQDLQTDPSNRDSNKGVVSWDYKPYIPLLESMKALNDNTYQLIRFFDQSKK